MRQNKKAPADAAGSKNTRHSESTSSEVISASPASKVFSKGWTKEEPLEIKVTKINGRYHIRLFREGSLHDESAVQLRCDIGYACRDMLRWYDKMCYEPFSKMAISARHRGKNHLLRGKLWPKHKLEYDRNLRERFKDSELYAESGGSANG